ncbi:MAG: Phenylalanine--tRNA ligase beta subunit [Phycisphaerae bacterium]|nr:Phenylalanine--tRNA ligase beta subunit [Phycisphaerae bacterium]
MFVSLHWLRDFIDLPSDLDVHELAQRFTTTCAEVEEVRHLQPGDTTPAEMACVVEDWIIEIDNKSITHRPDLWGHYGIAREVAALLQLPLKPLPIISPTELADEQLPLIPITIDDPQACPRYTGILLSGVRSQPSPALMQCRLSHVGMRPINALVDLTNYIMAEIGQPMHAFDGDRVQQIEVGFAQAGATFYTLDGQQRRLPAGALMIQSGRKPVALAGIMGGLESEVTSTTDKLLLESANFDPATIRRCATALGHRTEASARFEKALDPAWTVLGIARFLQLARQQFPDLQLCSQLSDCYPHPAEPRTIVLRPDYVSRFIGRNISLNQIMEILQALEFKLEDHDEGVRVQVPGFRATKDIRIEEDLIEEIARFVGYNNIDPILPQATIRHFPVNRQQRLEKRTLQLFCGTEGFFEVQDYLWYHRSWLAQLGYDPGDSVTLRNPAAADQDALRKSVIPGLLAAAQLNRRELPNLQLCTIGTVFPNTQTSTQATDLQERHLGLLAMRRGKKADDVLLVDLKNSLSKWALELIGLAPGYAPAAAHLPWENGRRCAEIRLTDQIIGRLATVPLELRRRIDEHFTAWSVVVAELNLSALVDVVRTENRLPAIPQFPEVELDFSVLAAAGRSWLSLTPQLAEFRHPLLRRLMLVDSYQGGNLPPGMRSLLLRVRLGNPRRTLVEDDLREFRTAFEQHLQQLQLTLRSVKDDGV